VKVNQLAPDDGATKSRKRVGRGPGSGHGRRATRGNKGQKAKTNISIWFEGGQMPLQRRLPKRGFKNPNREEYEVINLGRLAERYGEGEEVNPENLRARKMVRKRNTRVKLLGKGEIGIPLTIAVHAASAKAREAVEKAGGTVNIIEQK
jgi:large subunit ribosomal protein L15